MTPAQELTTLSPDDLIELLEVDMTRIGSSTIIRFWNGDIGELVFLAGQAYTPWPIAVSKYGVTSDGPYLRQPLRSAISKG